MFTRHVFCTWCTERKRVTMLENHFKKVSLFRAKQKLVPNPPNTPTIQLRLLFELSCQKSILEHPSTNWDILGYFTTLWRSEILQKRGAKHRSLIGCPVHLCFRLHTYFYSIIDFSRSNFHTMSPLRESQIMQSGVACKYYTHRVFKLMNSSCTYIFILHKLV